MAIEAGDAVWAIRGDYSELQAALGEATGQVESHTDRFKSNLKTVSTASIAVGGAITGALGGMVYGWASAGDELQKMSLRTGVSVEELDRLRFVLDQNGASIGDFEMAQRNLTRALDQARDGTGAQAEALQRLGLDFDTVRAMSPEEQFKTIAFAIGDMGDHTDQAALAMELFGSRVGTKLLPMIKAGETDFARLSARAEELGLMTTDSADAAAAFTDMMGELKESFRAVMIEMGPVIAELVTDFVPAIIETVANIAKWISENQGLVSGLVKWGGTIGAVLLGLGTLVKVLGPVVIAIKAVAGIAAVVAAVLSGPVVLAIGAVVGAGLLLYAFWDDIVSIVETAVTNLVDAAMWWKDTLVGIFEAVMEIGRAVIEAGWNAIVTIFETQVAVVTAIVKVLAAPFLWLLDVIGNAMSMVGIGSRATAAIPGMAEGGALQDGMAMVGERGPEAIIKRGSDVRVISAANTQAGGGPTINVNMGDVTVRDSADIDRLSEQLARATMTGLSRAGSFA